VEQNPEEGWRAVCLVTQASLDRYPDAKDRIAGIGVSGHRVASAVLYRHGRPLRTAILWLDYRSAVKADEL